MYRQVDHAQTLVPPVQDRHPARDSALQDLGEDPPADSLMHLYMDCLKRLPALYDPPDLYDLSSWDGPMSHACRGMSFSVECD